MHSKNNGYFAEIDAGSGQEKGIQLGVVSSIKIG